MECPKCGYAIYGRRSEAVPGLLISHRRAFVADMCEREDTFMTEAEARKEAKV